MDKTEPFRVFLKIFSIYGLDKSGKNSEKFWKFALFLLNVPGYLLFLVIVTTHLKSIEDKLQLVQIIPFYIIITVKAICVSMNFENILKFIDEVEKIKFKLRKNKFIENSHIEGMRLLKICFFFNFFPISCIQILSLCLQEIFFPTWTPDLFIRHKSIIFMIYWIIITFCGLYASLLVLSIDLLMIYLMIRIKGFSDYLIGKKVKFQTGKEKTIELRTLKFMQETDQLRR